MGLVASENKNGNFKPAPEGTHPARCVWVIDLGTQYSTKWDNYTHKVLLGWELPTKIQQATGDRPEEPFIVWSQYTLSLHKKAILRGVLESWRDRPFSPQELRGFDMEGLLRKECMLKIVHSKSEENTYANVAEVMSVPREMEVPEQFHHSVYFSIEQWDEQTFKSLADWLQEKIKNSIEYRSSQEEEEFVEAGAAVDDVPF